MPKFIPSFIFTVILAISFLASVPNVLAETTDPNIKANISSVSMTQKVTHNYSYVTCPGSVASVQPSFFARLLSAVGITGSLSVPRLADSSADCDVGGVISKVTNSSWSCTPGTEMYQEGEGIYVSMRRRFICSDEKAKQSETISFSPKYVERYGIVSCTNTHIYEKSAGTITNVCTGPKALPPSTTKVSFPPNIDINGIGFLRGRTLIGPNLQDYFTVSESVQSMLTLYPFGGSYSGDFSYRVPIGVILQQGVFNGKTGEFDLVPVKCATIKVAGSYLNTSCQTTVSATLGSMTITPSAPVPYYIYSEYVSGAITEK